MFMLMPRFRAECHAYREILRGSTKHQAVAWTAGWRTVAVDCTCGKSFGVDERYKPYYLAARAATPWIFERWKS